MSREAEILEALEALADQEGYKALEASWERSRKSALDRVTLEIIGDTDRAQEAAKYRAYTDVLTLRERTIKALRDKMNNEQGEQHG